MYKVVTVWAWSRTEAGGTSGSEISVKEAKDLRTAFEIGRSDFTNYNQSVFIVSGNSQLRNTKAKRSDHNYWYGKAARQAIYDLSDFATGSIDDLLDSDDFEIALANLESQYEGGLAK